MTSASRDTLTRDFLRWPTILLFGMAASLGPPDDPGIHLATIAATLGVVVIILYLARSPTPDVDAWRPGLLVAGCFILVRTLQPIQFTTDPPELARFLWPLLTCVLVIAGVFAAILGPHDDRRWRWSAACVLIAATISGIVVVNNTARPDIDVLHLHDKAAKAIVQGQSPYGQSVTVLDTSPLAPPGSEVTGYPYPPLVAVTYAIGSYLGDPRWISLASFLVTVIALSPIRGRVPGLGRVPGALLLVSLPGWPIVLYFGWTEPLTLMLVTLSLWFWARRPLLSAVITGLALVSKQYMLVVSPILVVALWRAGRQRTLLMMAAAGATLIPSVLTDWDNLIRSTITNLAALPVRPDGSSLQGLILNMGVGGKLPLVLTLGVPIGLAVWLGVRLKTLDEVPIMMALVLALYFLMGSQAFINYWFLVAGLAVTAASLYASQVPLAHAPQLSPDLERVTSPMSGSNEF